MGGPVQRIPEDVLDRIEREHAQGITSSDILELFAAHGIKFSEATLRKYVQLGLLPRSVRVGRKGKHQGSQGMYPVSVVRRILTIKKMMAEDFTIERIQREFLFIRNDIEELGRTLDEIFGKLDSVLEERRVERSTHAVERDVAGARALSKDLVARLEAIEAKLGARTKMEKLAAS